MKTILLSDFLEHIPDHVRIGIVHKTYKNGNEYNHTIYSGYKKGMNKYMEQKIFSPADYEVNYVYVGNWDNKFGLIINVKRY